MKTLDTVQAEGRSVSAATTPDTIAIQKITISPLNPRHGLTSDVQSLVEDIGVNQGILQPILLRKTQDGYEVIAGGRRFTALTQMRGSNGVLNANEYRIVDWDDDRCIRAAISENEQREDLSPLAEGRFLNNLAQQLAEQGVKKVTGDVLADKTGFGRQRVSDAMDLATNYHLLPKSWKGALATPGNCRLGDKPTITATHWKHVRKQVKGKIPKAIRSLMNQAAKEGWTAKTFKKALAKAAGGTSEGTAGDETNQGQPQKEPDLLNRLTEAEKHVRAAAEALHPMMAEKAEEMLRFADNLAKVIGKVKEIAAQRKAAAESSGDDNHSGTASKAVAASEAVPVAA